MKLLTQIKRCVSVILCLAFLWMIPLSISAAESPPSERSTDLIGPHPESYCLTIANVLQESGSLWCCAACGEIIMKYFGFPKVSQTIIAKYANGGVLAPLSWYATPPLVRPALAELGVTGNLKYSIIPFTALITEIYTHSRPFIASYRLRLNLEHSVVVYGYQSGSEHGLWYHDPMNGNRRYMLYNAFCNLSMGWVYTMDGFVKN